MTMIEDRELDTWREQWRNVAQPLPEIHKKIRRQNHWFVVSNVAALCGLVAALIFAAWAVHKQPSGMRIAWAIGLSVMVFVCAGYRIWLQRGTWRAESQSTRAFVELWHRRVAAKLRMLRMGFYLIPAWIIFCSVVAAANWSVIGPDVHAHPHDWVVVVVVVVLMVVAAFLKLAWYRRRKLRELSEVKTLLEELSG